MKVYIIRSVNTGRLIEAHDELSYEYGRGKVEMHNRLYPNDRWVMEAEEL